MPPAWAKRPQSVKVVQPALFDHARRGYRYGRIDLRHGPAPDNPWLAWALHLAHVMAEARGFDPIVRRTLNRNLVMLLADHSAGEVIRTSDFYEVVRDRSASLAHTSEVLQVMGILCDDRLQAFEQWLVGKLEGLAPGIGWEVQRWARTLRDGGPRTRARKQGTVQAATTPRARLVVALAAVHAARAGAIRAMQLSDVDLANRRLTIAGRSRPLDELTYQVLVAWLDHRRRRWPNTANPHLLISARTAVGLGPVSAPGINLVLRGLRATLERLHVDRQLEEALTHRADPLHLAVVFDLDESTAIRYAASARQLLQWPYGGDPWLGREPRWPWGTMPPTATRVPAEDFQPGHRLRRSGPCQPPTTTRCRCA